MRAGLPEYRFYAIEAVFEDSAGNVSRDTAFFSEPVWKVRATITREVGLPFVSEDGREVGQIEPFTLEFFIAAPPFPGSKGSAPTR
jgi:hypothetical protein